MSSLCNHSDLVGSLLNVSAIVPLRKVALGPFSLPINLLRARMVYPNLPLQVDLLFNSPEWELQQSPV
jgi:hypothetical protein